MKATEYNIQEERLDRVSAIGLCATLCEGGPEPDVLTINTRKQMERNEGGGGGKISAPSASGLFFR